MGGICDGDGWFKARVICRDGKERVARYKCRCDTCTDAKAVADAVKLPSVKAVEPEPRARLRPAPTPVSDPVGEEILAVVLKALGIRLEYLSSRNKSLVAIRARHVVICLLRGCRHPECPELSYRRIGWLLGIDQSTARVNWYENERRGSIRSWDYPRVPEVAPELLEGVYGH